METNELQLAPKGLELTALHPAEPHIQILPDGECECVEFTLTYTYAQSEAWKASFWMPRVVWEMLEGAMTKGKAAGIEIVNLEGLPVHTKVLRRWVGEG